MVCVNVINTTANIGKHIKFDTARNFSTVYHSMLDKSYDTFISAEKTAKIKSNPILEAVKKAVPMVKEPRVKIAENLRSMILDTASAVSEATGKDAVVFNIPNHENLVLRVEKSTLDKLDKLPKDLELIPIAHEKHIVDNPHLGLPLYYVTSKSSTIARKNNISAMEALSQPDKIMVLRKVTGQHPATECGEKLMSLMGFEDFANPDPNALNNFSYVFGYARKYFGNQAALKCLAMFRDGAKTIPENALGEGSSAFEVVNGQNFVKKYLDYSESYVKMLKDTADIPQSSYDDAVKFISSSKRFNVDFQHTNNTFVDLKKQEFNFMDFAFDKKDQKYIYENPVKEFRNVLFGKCFRRFDSFKEIVPCMPNLKYPRDLIIIPRHIQAIKDFSGVINDKVNHAAPEEFKSINPFK